MASVCSGKACSVILLPSALAHHLRGYVQLSINRIRRTLFFYFQTPSRKKIENYWNYGPLLWIPEKENKGTIAILCLTPPPLSPKGTMFFSWKTIDSCIQTLIWPHFWGVEQVIFCLLWNIIFNLASLEAIV